MNNFSWVFKHFNELTGQEVFEMLELRCRVFIVEQNCPYQDPDHKDRSSRHLLAYDGPKLAGCLRLVDPDVSYREASIGRVCTDHSYRGSGLGKLLMKHVLKSSLEYGYCDLRISAQSYLEKFYRDFGFVTVSEPYLEDNIPHIEMLLERSSTGGQRE